MKMILKAFVTWHKYDWNDKPEYELWPFDVSEGDPKYALVNTQEFEVEIPDGFDPRSHQVNALKKEKERILAETQVKVQNLEEQIQRLLCIEHDPNAEVSGNA